MCTYPADKIHCKHYKANQFLSYVFTISLVFADKHLRTLFFVINYLYLFKTVHVTSDHWIYQSVNFMGDDL